MTKPEPSWNPLDDLVARMRVPIRVRPVGPGNFFRVETDTEAFICTSPRAAIACIEHFHSEIEDVK